MENIKVSIIVPSYKRKKEMFSRAIESLLNQTYENIEIVVVDDNAKPDAVEYRNELESYIEQLNDDRIVYIQNEQNLGGAESRNVGLKHATGDYVTFLDDDDRYLKNKVKHQVEFMIENDLEMSFTNIVICDGDDKVVDYRAHRDIKSFDNDYLMRYHLTKQITTTNTFMYKLDSILKIGGFINVPMGQEYYLMFNTIDKGLKIGYLDCNECVLYRQGQECISNGANKKAGHKKLYEFKKSHFDKLTFRDKIYVRFRYHAVLVVVNLRLKKYFSAIGQAFVAGLCSPIDLVIEVCSFIKKTSDIELGE